jgi:hypothetical protein
MIRDDTPYTDPLIDEVRERRHKLLAEHGDDLAALCRAIEQLQAQHPEKVSEGPRRRGSCAARATDPTP